MSVKQTSKIDPQPISNRLYKCVYTDGVKHVPSFQRALDKLSDYLDKYFAYIERKLLDAEGLNVKRIREMMRDGEIYDIFGFSLFLLRPLLDLRKLTR